MNDPVIAIIGLVAAIALLIFFVVRTKVHALLALVIAASIAALAAGMAPAEAIATITTGFGATLASIGLVIGFGVMLGRVLESSGAAERLAIALVRGLGKGREQWAMAGAGFIVSIPVFVDSTFIILSPLVKSLARTAQRSVITLGIALAAGAVVMHHAVPPTPGPLAAASIFGVPLGELFIWGTVIAIPAAVAMTLYATWVGPRIEAKMAGTAASEMAEESIAVSAAQGGGSTLVVERAQGEALAEFEAAAQDRVAKLPSLFMSLLPIFVPILLIVLNTSVSALAENEALNVPEWVAGSAAFVGSPVIALLIGVLLAIYGLARQQSREGTLADMEKGIESAGIILLVTGAGGALGAVLRESGLGDTIGQWVAGLPLPSILIPFIIASLVRVVQGSGTVAIITAASIAAPIMADVPDVNMTLAALAACMGAMVFSYFNDSLFWVVNRTLGITDAKLQMRAWSVTTTIGWAVSLVVLLVLNLFL